MAARLSDSDEPAPKHHASPLPNSNGPQSPSNAANLPSGLRSPSPVESNSTLVTPANPLGVTTTLLDSNDGTPAPAQLLEPAIPVITFPDPDSAWPPWLSTTYNVLMTNANALSAPWYHFLNAFTHFESCPDTADDRSKIYNGASNLTTTCLDIELAIAYDNFCFLRIVSTVILNLYRTMYDVLWAADSHRSPLSRSIKPFDNAGLHGLATGMKYLLDEDTVAKKAVRPRKEKRKNEAHTEQVGMNKKSLQGQKMSEHARCALAQDSVAGIEEAYLRVSRLQCQVSILLDNILQDSGCGNCGTRATVYT
ncbi:hypothetical protein IMY05_C3651001300 [Salix suchowensis]|nr:hypothetical protein IMY05_C3651001300 [Salix suchowensis]